MRTPGLPAGAFSLMVGQRIRWLREVSDLSQNDVQKKVGVAPNTLHRYERGLCSISLNALESIADALGVPATLLCGPTEDFAEKIRSRIALAEAPNATKSNG